MADTRARMRGALRRSRAFTAAALALSPAFAWAGEAGAAHADPIAKVVLHLAVILLAAKLGGELAALGQPAVLGEMLAGIALGNLSLLGVHVFDALGRDPAVDTLAQLGVLILLFEIGLVIVVIVTTLVTPPALRWSVARKARAAFGADPAATRP